MKILHIIDSGGMYGAETMLLNLVEEQVKLNLDPTIASIGSKKTEVKPIEAESANRALKVKIFRMAPGPNIFGAIKILRFAKKNNFDLLHSHGYKGNILFGFLLKFIRSIPIVSTLHGWTNTSGLSKLKVYEWLDSWSLQFINKVVLVNKGMLSNPKLKHRHNMDFQIVNNGIPLPSIQNKNNSSSLDVQIIDFCSKGFCIGSIGRLSVEKGYEYLINAFVILRKKGMDVRLIIIGEGNQRSFLEKIILEHNIEKFVFLPGYKNQAKKYLQCFNVYVISSLTEGLPITLLEAMQAKVPVVASRVGGIPHVLCNEKDGLLINPKKPGELAQAIFKIYNSQELKETIVKTAFENVCSNYSSKQMASEYFKIYSQLTLYK